MPTSSPKPSSKATSNPANLGITNTIGDILILSATAGGIAPPADAATGMYVTVLGVAKSSTLVNFKPLASGAAIP